ncbi:heme A synthase [uncultured Microscilla sp.]|uniref:COX15/CtaA family protein n=1 Tax=uncultured Microscilla sp. TaxID=432653 RepID=UPI00263133B6|nr:COX15/CtaA family protein [uncultured Microscilla sp.]
MSNKNTHKIFRKLGIVTIVAVYFLIAVGGIVRTTGAGMGCPDWPKCFGSWIPPTEVSQLPKNYKEKFKVQGKEIADFNPVKTWIEYINRLIGALIGLLIFATFIASFTYWKVDRSIVFLSFASVLLVGFQGWIGAKVVATDLAVSMITIHMVLALAIVFLLIYTIIRGFKVVWKTTPITNKKRINQVIILGLVLSFIQVVLGTQVREAIDLIAKNMGEAQRGLWVDNLGMTFYIHRSFSWIVFLTHVYLVYLLYTRLKERNHFVFKYTIYLFLIIISEVATGIAMAYFGIPAFLQPIHLLLGSLVLGIQFFLLLAINYERVFVKKGVNSLGELSQEQLISQ